jgi:hypothetical protein
MRRWLWFAGAVLLGWLAFMAWVVWPTLWEHRTERRESMLENPDGSYNVYDVEIRQHRITGEMQRKSADGTWVPDYVE